jgi:hypothetical protein
MDGNRIRKLLVVMVVVLCTLAVSTSATLLAHDHRAGPGNCNLCAICHMAWQQPANLASLLPPSMREWRDTTERRCRISETRCTETPSRAPPA